MMSRKEAGIIKIKNNGIYRHRGEMLAADFLREKGHSIICHNFHVKFAEIDLVTLENDKIHFIEVKNYAINGRMHPLEMITGHKMNKMRQASRIFYREYLNYSCEKNNHPDGAEKIIIDIVALQPSFDLLWVKDDDTFEYFCELF